MQPRQVCHLILLLVTNPHQSAQHFLKPTAQYLLSLLLIKIPTPFPRWALSSLLITACLTLKTQSFLHRFPSPAHTLPAHQKPLPGHLISLPAHLKSQTPQHYTRLYLTRPPILSKGKFQRKSSPPLPKDSRKLKILLNQLSSTPSPRPSFRNQR